MYFKITKSNIIGGASTSQNPYDNIKIKTNKWITIYIHGLGIN